MAGELAQGVDHLPAGVLGGMRMHAGGGAQSLGIGPREVEGSVAARLVGPGDHESSDAGLPRARQHGLQVVVEGLVREIGADVD